jgi:hypothetical protein
MVKKWYEVEFEMKQPHKIRVIAHNKIEAKKKAFVRFKLKDNLKSYKLDTKQIEV